MVTWSDAILGCARSHFPEYRNPTFDAVFLSLFSRPRDDYIATILRPATWGGAIELTILANHYGTEICSVDVETGRVDRFTPERGDGNRCVLIYSGIHYDAATIAPILDVPDDFHQTRIPIQSEGDDDPILVATKKLADKLRAKRAYTNTATFDLKCQVVLVSCIVCVLAVLLITRLGLC